MAKILAISSQVVHGHVGNSAGAFILQRLGHEVLNLPTVILSNRPGYKAIAGERASAEKLHSLMRAISDNGWLDTIDAILTGYLPSAEIVEFCREWVVKIKSARPQATYLCDPIIGDEPTGLYIDGAAAALIRDALVPLADIVTPNAFELSWLARRPAADMQAAVEAARSLSRPAVVVTSAPAAQPGMLANILVRGHEVAATASERRRVKAHGMGDFFASLFLARVLAGMSLPMALSFTQAAVDLVLDQSEGLTELALVQTQAEWAAKEPKLAQIEPAAQLFKRP